MADAAGDGKEEQLDEGDKPMEFEAGQRFEYPFLNVAGELDEGYGAEGEERDGIGEGHGSDAAELSDPRQGSCPTRRARVDCKHDPGTEASTLRVIRPY